MTKKLKKIFAIGLVLALSVVAFACADTAPAPEYQPYAYAPVAYVPAAPVDDDSQVAETEIIEVEYMEYVEYEEEYQLCDSILARVERMIALGDRDTVDMSVIISLGLEEAAGSPLTYEYLVGLLETFIISEMTEQPFPNMDYLLEEYSIQLRISMSYDEFENSAFSIGLPSENGGFIDIISYVFIDEVVYLGVAVYIELASELITTALDQMVAAGMSPLEASMIGIIIGDILGRFDGTEYLAIDLSDFMDTGELYSQAEDWQEFLIETFETFEQLIQIEPIIDILIDLGIIFTDDDWVVIEFSEQVARELVERAFDWIIDHAEETTDALNAILSNQFILDAFGTGVPIEQISVEELREELELADLSVFDEFEGFFTIRMREDGDTLYEEIIAVISTDEDSFRIEISGYSAARTQPVSAPAASTVMTMRELFDEVLIDFTGIGYDDLLNIIPSL